MNITDVKLMNVIAEKGTEDMLREIFAKQFELMQKYHEIEEKNGCLITPDVPVDIHSHKGQQRLKDFAWRITEELGEACNCLKNKPWKLTPMSTDVQHFREEVGDAFHFFIEFCILAGISADDLFDIYMRKNHVNIFRQGSGY